MNVGMMPRVRGHVLGECVVNAPVSRCHVWTAAVDAYPVAPGVNAGARCPQDFPVEAHRARMGTLGVTGAVLVPHIAYYGRDLRYALDCARRYPGDYAVLGAITAEEVADPSRIAAELREGIRAFRVRAPDLLQHPVAALARVLIDQSAVLCPLVKPGDEAPDLLARILAIARAHPELPLVLDHFGGVGAPYRLHLLLPFADLRQVAVKVSGFNQFDAPPYALARQSLLELCRRFGAQRLLWGSDMPVLEAGGGQSVEAAFAMVAEAPKLTREEKDAVLGGTARGIYFGS